VHTLGTTTASHVPAHGCPQVKRLWWIPVEGRSIGVPASMSFTDFAPMPMLLKQNA
jgi:hypothetical protein